MFLLVVLLKEMHVVRLDVWKEVNCIHYTSPLLVSTIYTLFSIPWERHSFTSTIMTFFNEYKTWDKKRGIVFAYII